MNAINFKTTTNSTIRTEILRFPNKQEAKELKIIPWVNDNNAMHRREIERRNSKANQYINSCKQKRVSKRKSFFTEVLSGVLMSFMIFGIFALYFTFC